MEAGPDSPPPDRDLSSGWSRASGTPPLQTQRGILTVTPTTDFLKVGPKTVGVHRQEPGGRLGWETYVTFQ